MKPRMTHAILVGLIAFGGLFALKYTVEQKEQRLAEMKTQYLADQKALRVLKAEWAYLNSPEYLQGMAEKYLVLKPLGSKQVVAWIDVMPNGFGDSRNIAIALARTGGEETPPERALALPPGGGDDP